MSEKYQFIKIFYLIRKHNLKKNYIAGWKHANREKVPIWNT